MENLHDLASKSFTYKPPLSLQSLQIWSLVIARSREEKVSEFNFTRKSPFALNTWENAIKRFNNPTKVKYANVVGIVSDQVITIDIDFDKTKPENYLRELPDKYKIRKGDVDTRAKSKRYVA